jgi:predicted amidohydrolase
MVSSKPWDHFGDAVKNEENLKVAAVVMQSAVGKTAENLGRMGEFACKAAAKKVQVLCFPELALSGYSLSKEILSIAEPIPGPSSNAVLEIARRNQICILTGLIERDGTGRAYMSHIAASPQGLLGTYRKMHLGPAEEGIFHPGEEPSAFCYGGWRGGMELCFDGHFPELSTMLALQGCQVIFIPHASPRESPREKRERWLRYLAARAYDNSVFLVACNQVGPSEMGLNFPAAALILSPRGEVLATNEGDGEEMVTTDLESAALEEIRGGSRGFFLKRRRPVLYRDLAI